MYINSNPFPTCHTCEMIGEIVLGVLSPFCIASSVSIPPKTHKANHCYWVLLINNSLNTPSIVSYLTSNTFQSAFSQLLQRVIILTLLVVSVLKWFNLARYHHYYLFSMGKTADGLSWENYFSVGLFLFYNEHFQITTKAKEVI